MKLFFKLGSVGLIFLLLLQVQARGEEGTEWGSTGLFPRVSHRIVLWTGSLASHSKELPNDNKTAGNQKSDSEKKNDKQATGKAAKTVPQTILPSGDHTGPGGTPENPGEDPPGNSTPIPLPNQAHPNPDFSNILYYCGPSQSKKIALTFDDGPSEVTSNQALDILKEYNVKATFFLLGQNIPKYPKVVQRMVREGHVVAGHSWSHKEMDTLSPEGIEKEIMCTEDAIYQLTGANIALFRPPYGKIHEDGLTCFQQKGYNIINWSVDSLDWKFPDNIPMVKYNTFKNIRGGAIILFHTMSGREPSQIIGKLLPEMIQTLRGQGYQFVTVDELLSVPAYKL